MSHDSLPVSRIRRGATTLLAAAIVFRILGPTPPAEASVTARIRGMHGSVAAPPERQPPRVLDADSVHSGLRRRLEQGEAARQRTLQQRRIERPAAPVPPLPRHFDPERWSR